MFCKMNVKFKCAVYETVVKVITYKYGVQHQ